MPLRCRCGSFLARPKGEGVPMTCNACGAAWSPRIDRSVSNRIGGLARAAKLSPEQRKAIAQKAIAARWAKEKNNA